MRIVVIETLVRVFAHYIYIYFNFIVHYYLFTENVTRPLLFKSCDVRLLSVVCPSVPSVGNQNKERWRLVVQERIAKIAKQLTPHLVLKVSTFFLCIKIFCVLGSVW